MPFAGFLVDEVRQVYSLMRQQEKMPPRAGDAAVKTRESSGIGRISVLLAILVFCFDRGAALDPTSRISQYGHTVWRLQDGYFGGATPTSITQTTDGYIWVGTVAGLYRFDGARFVRWNSPSGEELPSSYIVNLLGARDGSLWIGTSNGLVHLVKDRRSVYQKNEGWHISSIVEDKEGKIWFSGFRRSDRARYLCQVLETGVRCYGTQEGLSFAFLVAQDPSGDFWLGGPLNLVKWRPGSRPQTVLSRHEQNVVVLLPESSGSAWVGIDPAGRGGGLQRLIDGTLRPFLAPKLNGETIPVSALQKDRQGNLWVGTDGQGLFRIRGTDVDHYGTAEGLPNDVVLGGPRGIFEDREGNIWVVTGQGLEMFRDLPVRRISKREGLDEDGVDAVAAARDGSVWIGANHLQLLGPHGVSFGPWKDLPGRQSATTFIDHAGRLWTGMGQKLFVYEQGRFREITKADGSDPGMAVGITEDTAHNIWVETGGQVVPAALLLIQNLKVRREFPPSAVPSARKIVADPRGGVWLGLMTGDLARYRDGQINTFTFGDHPKSTVSAIMVASDGSVLGATGFGVVGWKDGKKQILNARNGLPCNEVNSLISDDAGSLWLYAQCGLIKIGNDQMQLWWEHPDRKLKLRVFDAFDGVQPGFAYFNNSTKTPDGRLWFANGTVVQVVDPAHTPENTVPPPVEIGALVADHKAYALGSATRLPQLTRDLEIDYTALSYVAPQKVLFRYMLEGHDAGWQDPGTRREAFYNDLRPGQYRFRVIACNNDGIWNDTGATLDFSIAPAWFQTKWFLALSVLSGFMLVWAFFSMRTRQIQTSLNARFNERLAERTRMARELHDTFLQTLQGSKLVADDALEKSSDPVHMRKAAEQLSAWLERAIHEGRAALNSLRTSTTQTNDLAEAFTRATEESRMQSRMEVSFSVTGDSKEIHPVVRDEIYRIGYEAIRNAYTHSNGDRLEVSLRYGKDLAVCVSDNGVGIDPSVADQGKDGHFGLQGMRERAARIGGKLLIVSSPNSGTEVKIVVPGGIVFRRTRATLLDKMKNVFRRAGRTFHAD